MDDIMDDKPPKEYSEKISDRVRIIGSSFRMIPEFRHKLKNHEFIVEINSVNDLFKLPKNFSLLCKAPEKILNEVIVSQNRHDLIAAVRHGILNESNVDMTIGYAVENHLYNIVHKRQF